MKLNKAESRVYQVDLSDNWATFMPFPNSLDPGTFAPNLIRQGVRSRSASDGSSLTRQLGRPSALAKVSFEDIF